jgi:hypothetical protein
MKKTSPEGVLALEVRADLPPPASESVNSAIADVLAWAHKVLCDSKIEIRPSEARKLARQRDHLDAVHWALMAVHEAERLRHSLAAAKDRGVEFERYATWAADQMWNFAAAVFLGKFIEKEPQIFKGLLFTEGPKKKRQHDDGGLIKKIDAALAALGARRRPKRFSLISRDAPASRSRDAKSFGTILRARSAA